MSRYVSIETKMWHDEKFRELPEDARVLFLYLLSSPHSNMCGLFFLPPGYACHDLQWKEEKYKKTIEKLKHKKMILTDGDIILIKNYLKYNPIRGPKQAAGAANRLREVPKTELIGYFIECLKLNVKENDYKKFIETYQIPNRYPIDTLPIPDSDPDSDPEEDSEADPEEERVPPAPHQKIVDLFNATCKTFPQVKNITEKRKNKIRVIWNEKPKIEIFETLFNKANDSDFLSGRNGKWGGCSFDWLINYNNAVKVLEGNYDNNKKSTQPAAWTTLKEWYEEGVEKDEQGGIYKNDGFPDGGD